MTVTEHDVVAVGCGPFNLGLAALADGVDDLDVAVFDRAPELRWHPGLMFDDAMLQVSFLADLVTLVDPTHRLSFLAYLRDADRLFPFYVREQFHPTRPEYEDYLRWAASQLPSVRFGHDVRSVTWDGATGRFRVEVVGPDGTPRVLSAADVVLGIGTEPFVPDALAALPAERLLHSSDYLHRRDTIAAASKVTVVGSGQSGAEVALDLLRRHLDGGGPEVAWLTRSSGFAPLDYSKFLLEMTTPQYVDHFHSLPTARRDRLVADQWRHYKGVSEETLDQLHDVLYRRELVRGLAPVELRQGLAIETAEPDGDGLLLTGRDADTGESLRHRTGVVVAATGYRERRPELLAPLEDVLHRDERGRFVVRRDHSVELDPSVTGRVFVANADTHSHGVAAPDLGLGAARNATIINTVTGRKVYPLPGNTAFITFGRGHA